jgi:hypothetical protein
VTQNLSDVDIQKGREKPSVSALSRTQHPGTTGAEAAWTHIFQHTFSSTSPTAPASDSVPEMSPDRIAADKLQRNRYLVDDELQRYEEEVIELDYWNGKQSELQYWGVSDAHLGLFYMANLRE